MPTIADICVAGPDMKARRLTFLDAEPRLTSAAVVRHLDLSPGSVTDEADILIAERELVRERALRILGYRERSRSELRTRLVRDGYPHELADEVVDRFTELGLVDDSRFADAWARMRLSAGLGTRRIERELRERGVDPETISNALSSAECPDESERAFTALKGAVPHDARERDRLVRRLVSRGYSLDAALSAVARAQSEAHDPSEQGR